MFIDEHTLPLGALLWAAIGKDPGFTPTSLLEIIKRRGKYRPEDFSRLHLTEPVDVVANKGRGLTALDEAETFIRSRPASESGCLYYSPTSASFVVPGKVSDATPHFGTPGGVLPMFLPEQSPIAGTWYCHNTLLDTVLHRQ